MAADASNRRNLITNALNLVRVTKGKNIILSSAARRAIELRGPHDVINLYDLVIIISSSIFDSTARVSYPQSVSNSQLFARCFSRHRSCLFGIATDVAKNTLSANCYSVIMHGGTSFLAAL